MLSRGNVEFTMLEIINVYWVEGYFAGIDKKIQVPTTEGTFKTLVREGFESYDSIVEFAVGKSSEVLYRNYVVCVPFVTPYEDQYKTIGEYKLMA